MIIVTTETIPGYKITEIKGIAQGSTIQCKNIGRDIGSSFRQLVGGEMESYTKMMNEARDLATQRMKENAEALGANAVISFKYSSSAVMTGAAEILAYGTAAVIEKE